MARNMDKTLCERICSIADADEYSYEWDEDMKSLAWRPDGCPGTPRDTLIRAIGEHADAITQDLWTVGSADLVGWWLVARDSDGFRGDRIGLGGSWRLLQ